jgi:hypothetical protein
MRSYMIGRCAVDLQQEAGVDDRPIFLVQRIRHGEDEIRIVFIIFVQPVRNNAARRHGRHESLRDARAAQRCLEIFDIASNEFATFVGDGADAGPIALGADKALGLVVFRVEFGKPLAIAAFGDDLAGPKAETGALLEAGQTIEDIARPARRFAELAVADDVDANRLLFADNLRHRRRELRRIAACGTRIAGVRGFQECHEFGRPGEAADVSGQYFLVAALHDRLVDDVKEIAARRRPRGSAR